MCSLNDWRAVDSDSTSSIPGVRIDVGIVAASLSGSGSEASFDDTSGELEGSSVVTDNPFVFAAVVADPFSTLHIQWNANEAKGLSVRNKVGESWNVLRTSSTWDCTISVSHFLYMDVLWACLNDFFKNIVFFLLLCREVLILLFGS